MESLCREGIMMPFLPPTPLEQFLSKKMPQIAAQMYQQRTGVSPPSPSPSPPSSSGGGGGGGTPSPSVSRGTYQARPGAPLQVSTTEETVLTPPQFQQQLKKQEIKRRLNMLKAYILARQARQTHHRIQRIVQRAPVASFVTDNKIITGEQALQISEKQMKQISQYFYTLRKVGDYTQMPSKVIGTQSSEWSPQTRVIQRKTEKGVSYEFRFPYRGAEHYKQYQKALRKNLVGGALATSLTPEDPLGLVSAYYMTTGEKQRAEEVKIKSIARIKSLKSPVEFAQWWFESPQTQIVAATLGGYAIGKVGGTIAGRLSMNIVHTRLFQGIELAHQFEQIPAKN